MTLPLLSFDDGPSTLWTPQILNLLAEHETQGMFFLVGASIRGRESIVQRIHDEGHVVGNHTLDHIRLTTLEDGQVRLQLQMTQLAIESIIGVYPKVWRAPFFGTDPRVNAIAESLGLEHVRTDIVTDDCFTDDSEAIARKVLNGIREGAQVACLHDGVPPDGGSGRCTQSRQPSVEAVRLILEALA